MTVLKRILNYLIWTILAVIAAFSYMRIILGAKSIDSNGFAKIANIIYDLAFVQIGLILGSIIAIIYILIDIFYLSNRLKNTKKSTIIRLLVIFVIAVIIVITHYVLEKVIDII
ncbi:hypothetical protein [Winogradskyella psychrotolerans]|uniref:hypothetical protein n=1 Tax=Winogradskyella psychrotolerans TaxID=1344585 RepID=UPI001C06FD36|nr:hypothetical protein [Winogradskyella psychrotolerans]MBU2930244.1 hypothetical protein [Winogradskyella psychrotolerans]